MFGGWEVAGIFTARTGLPFTPTISSDNANTGVGGQRPSVVGQATAHWNLPYTVQTAVRIHERAIVKRKRRNGFGSQAQKDSPCGRPLRYRTWNACVRPSDEGQQ
jgi:hypothetical protein